VTVGGGITVCAILMTSYRPVPTSRTTNTRTFTGSSTRCLNLISQVCPVRSILTFFDFSGFLLTNSCSRTMRAWARRIRLELRFFDGRGPRYSTMTRLQLVGKTRGEKWRKCISVTGILRGQAQVRTIDKLDEVCTNADDRMMLVQHCSGDCVMS